MTAAAVVVAEVEKTHLVVADTTEIMISTTQVQQVGLPVKFVVSLLYTGIQFAMQSSAVLWRAVAVVSLKKIELANIKAAAFLLDFGDLLNCAFSHICFFLFGCGKHVLTLHLCCRCLLICWIFLLFKISLKKAFKSKYAIISSQAQKSGYLRHTKSSKPVYFLILLTETYSNTFKKF